MAVAGKTQKFQSLSNQVKSQVNTQQKPQEKKLSTDQITKLFDDFGYQPEKADLTYWSHQPEESETKLVNDLKARRDEEKTAQKETQTKQQGPSHLTDQQITSLYSEYGFPAPKSSSDFEWVRQNFPDDENKLRAIFDEKRKQMDQMMKIKGKNMIDNVKQQTSPSPTQQPGAVLMSRGQGGMGDGQGGPADGTSGTSGTSNGTKWVFPSRYVPVKFSGDPNGSGEGDANTIWLLDSQTKQIQPFLSMTAFQNFYGDNATTALKNVTVLNPNDLGSNDTNDFNLLGSAYGINDSGQVPVVDATASQIKSLYGQSSNPGAVSQAYAGLDGFLDLLNKNGGEGIDTSTIGSVLNDQTQMAKYIGAMAYGGYSLNDVYSDIKRKDLISKGDQSLANTQVIDPSLTKQQYLNTTAGQQSQGIATIMPPASIGGISSAVLNSPIASLPQDAFNTLVPPLDPSSPEFKSQMDSVQSAFHDILLDQVNATTEADKSSADSKYNDYRDYIQNNYGIRLSMDITQGWQQLQQIMAQSSNNGIAGSGIEAGQMEDELKRARTQDERWRGLQTKDEETAAADNAKAYASPADILKMNQEDQAAGLPKDQWRSTRWGLTPSDATLASLDINALKQKYPNASDADLQQMRSQVLDENGNYRSTLYQNKADSNAKIINGGTLNDQLATTGSLQDYKENTVYNKNLAAEAKAAAPYTQTDPTQPFDKTGITTDTPKNDLTTTTTTPKYNDTVKTDANSQIVNNTTTATNATKTINPVKVPATIASPSTPPAGMVAINGAQYGTKATQQAAYSNITPIGNTLYGTPKTSTVTSTSPNSAFQIKPGTSYIPNTNSMSKYKDIYKDTTPGSTKLYGTLI